MQSQTNITIQVIGSGCPTCKNLYEITQKAIQSLGLDAKVDYINDITKILEMGLMTSPVLVVNGKAVMTGYTSNIEKIKELINLGIKNTSDLKTEDSKSLESNCSCNGCCS